MYILKKSEAGGTQYLIEGPNYLLPRPFQTQRTNTGKKVQTRKMPQNVRKREEGRERDGILRQRQNLVDGCGVEKWEGWG